VDLVEAVVVVVLVVLRSALAVRSITFSICAVFAKTI
jgi:hypothetical protein